MRRMRRLLALLPALLLALLPPAAAASELPLHQIKLPPGFRIALFARVDNARGMALGAGTPCSSARCAPARCMR